MAIKIVALFAIVSAVSAASIGYAPAPVYNDPALVKTVAAPLYHHEVPAEYDFHYAVHDEHTGDIKSQQESRRGDVVHGRYELIDSDGFHRIVDYSADEHTGFNAVVHREPINAKIQVAAAPKIAYAASLPVAKVVAPAPAIAHYAAPISAHLAAPVAHFHH